MHILPEELPKHIILRGATLALAKRWKVAVPE